ncbi:Hypothetical_protein [Hexamita inflata]|uniref:Hypothetical_protein n=1 Tax=Hexamita inflata TaxID=28002 RepID=A0ABP1IL44_9EUKA
MIAFINYALMVQHQIVTSQIISTECSDGYFSVGSMCLLCKGGQIKENQTLCECSDTTQYDISSQSCKQNKMLLEILQIVKQLKYQIDNNSFKLKQQQLVEQFINYKIIRSSTSGPRNCRRRASKTS